MIAAAMASVLLALMLLFGLAGYVVNHFFASAEACKSVEARWTAEAQQILAKKNSEQREILLAGRLLKSKCIPAAALSMFKVRPGVFFEP